MSGVVQTKFCEKIAALELEALRQRCGREERLFQLHFFLRRNDVCLGPEIGIDGACERELGLLEGEAAPPGIVLTALKEPDLGIVRRRATGRAHEIKGGVQ